MMSFSNLTKPVFWQEAKFYGADILALNGNSHLFYKASWMHGLGCYISGLRTVDCFIHPAERHLPIHLVNNLESVQYLEDLGYSSVAVGIPFIYSDYLEFSKNKNREHGVFVPEHDISKSLISRMSEYYEIARKYNCNSICLPANDYISLQKKGFQGEYDITLLKGATAGDSDSLNRVAKIFSSFKNIYTNCFGSHLFYASLCGAQVIMIDEYLENYSEENERLRMKSLEKKMLIDSFKEKSKLHGALNNPLNKVWINGSFSEMIDLSEVLSGISYKRSSEELYSLLVEKNSLLLSKLIFQTLKNKFMLKAFRR